MIAAAQTHPDDVLKFAQADGFALFNLRAPCS
jgi:hypothetical protein